MQITISPNHFLHITEKALENKCSHFYIFGNKATIEFVGIETLKFPVGISDGYRKANYAATFTKDKWEKIMDFVRQCPTYPITIRFTQYYTDDSCVNENPGIQLSELITDF